MAGVKGKSGRPGGAPENLTSYTTDRDEPLLAKLQLRVGESMMQRVKSIDEWQEFVRQAIQRALDEMDDPKNS
ncbi:hypothetical protein IQ235_07950 [Oscillatoriales cyanobacterium LEGE 11467]|uniref:Uncharacterized protein n=1 Tax=Zarconia navalis LEGE 11467 TaxID=1828826 RepID=A0A928VYN8_9CYAN|nr:hypothetical protein [Zarconia navalis]MBE9040711.1 hypothetical protein [Zarconia navalis LEGE 11467]